MLRASVQVSCAITREKRVFPKILGGAKLARDDCVERRPALSRLVALETRRNLMPTQRTHQTAGPDFSRQIAYLRNLEPPNEFAFALQVALVLVGCFAAYLFAGWWEVALWSVVYVLLQFCEKIVVRKVPDAPSLPAYGLVLVVLTVEALVFCFMPVYLWFLGPDIGKFGALALITASTMHTMLNRAAFPSILLCFLVPDASVFAVIVAVTVFAVPDAAYLVLFITSGTVICAFFLTMFFQAYQKEAKAYREMEDRQSAEAAREASEIRFKSLFESAPIPIREEDLSGMKRMIDDLGIPDPDAFAAYLDEHPEFLEAASKEIVVVDANNASLAQHGYTEKSEMLEKVVGTLSPAAMKIVRMTVETLHSGAPGRSYDTKITRTDGAIRDVAATWSVIPGHEDTYARILLCSLDMTEHLRSEEALRHAQKMEAVGQLTGGVAHDFNNLLTVIGGNVDLMEESRNFEPALATPIKKAVSRGAELTQRLLAFSRKQPLEPQSVDIGGLVTEMSELIARSIGDEITVEIELEPELWPACVDPGQVEASLLNLALNSRDAMPEGGTLTISSRNAIVGEDGDMDLDPGNYVVLEIADTGTGMPPDVLSRAYEPFFTTKEVGKGSGLGLPSVYGFARQSGGDVRIESTVGVGTTVALYLRRSSAHQSATLDQPKPIERVNGAGKTVLILEDNPGVQRYLVQTMTLQGFDVHTADDAAQARELLSAGKVYDLLISDVMLPGGVRGPEFAAELLEACPGTGILFVSGRPTEAKLDAYPTLRTAKILQKPFSRDDLISQVQNSLASSGHRVAPGAP